MDLHSALQRIYSGTDTLSHSHPERENERKREGHSGHFSDTHSTFISNIDVKQSGI